MLKIIHWPHPTLSTVAKPIHDFSPHLRTLIDEMFEAMKDANGIGLAAPQINRSIRLFVIEIPFVEYDDDYDDDEDEDEYEDALAPGEQPLLPNDELQTVDLEPPEEAAWWHNKKHVFINPTITKHSGKVKTLEGCLSLPNVTEEVVRHKTIWVSYLDQNGQPQEIEASGLFSICIQHELDHLDGKVFIQRLSRIKFQLLKHKILKAIEQENERENEQSQFAP